jgi:hypothetical protein
MADIEKTNNKCGKNVKGKGTLYTIVGNEN